VLSDEDFKACVVPMTTTTGKVIVSDGFGGRSRSDHNSRGLLPINRCLHRGGTKWASPPALFYQGPYCGKQALGGATCESHEGRTRHLLDRKARGSN